MILPRAFIATQYFCVAHELGGLAADFIALAVRAMIEVVAKCDLSQPCLTLPPSGSGGVVAPHATRDVSQGLNRVFCTYACQCRCVE